MRPFTLLLVSILFAVPCFGQSFSWTMKQSFPGSTRSGHVAFTLNGKGYITTGAGSTQLFNDTWEYDAATNSWTQKASFSGTARSEAVGFVAGNFAYVGCGLASAPLNDFYRYDALLNTWTNITAFPGSARSNAIAFSDNNNGYVGLGYPFANDLYKYDPLNNSWAVMASLPASGTEGASVICNSNKAYIICGRDTNGLTDSNWEYDITNNTWTSRSSFPGTARYEATSAFLNGKGVIGSGTDASGCAGDWYSYIPETDTWCSQQAPNNAQRSGAASFVINNRMYLVMGECNSITVADNEELKIQSAAISYQQIVCNTYEFNPVLLSGASGITWYFGDGTSSTAGNVTHTFPHSGNYTVSLVVQYSCGRDSIVQNVTTGLGSTSTFDVSIDTCNLSIQISNQSFTGFTFQWLFGDGAASTQVNPSHTYAAYGNYILSLIVTDDCGSDTILHPLQLLDPAPPDAQFNTNVQNCSQTVNFTNTSFNAVNLSWDFGDGTTSNQLNPSHVYNSAGNFTVWLYVNNSCGTDSVSQNITVSNSVLTTASFTYIIDSCNLSVSLTNTSSNASSYSWDFGDGTNDTTVNTIHIYDAAVVWQVTLVAQGLCGPDTSIQNITIPSPPAPPTSSFTSQTDTCSGTLLFTNNSINAQSYSWNFGDSTSSLQPDPTHTYNSSGTYTVTLTATGSCTSDTSIITVTILPYQIPNAAFSASIDTCNYLVTFTNNTVNGITYNWDFGDGNGDSVANPVHVYSSTGVYPVNLIAFNYCNSDTITQIITLNNAAAPSAAFTYQLDTCNAQILFSNNSSDAFSYYWDFGDSIFSNLASPSHNYNAAGNYTVTLVATGSCTSDTIMQNVTILPYQVPSAAFTNAIDSCNYTVSLTNTSLDAINYQWLFGDSSSASSVNPVHTYNNTGNYTITLIASNYCQSDTITQNITLNTTIAPVAVFTYQLDTCNALVTFNNTSTSANTYNWSFGDNTNSNLTSPSHIYNAAGTYTVTLIAAGTCSNDTTTQNVTVLPYQMPSPAFSINIDSCNYTVNFANLSQSSVFYSWNFGDGNSDTSVNPVHIYSNAGNYSITLVASNYCQSDTITQNIILSNVTTPSAAFTWQLDTCNATVLFNNTSTGGISWNWSFGDNSFSTISAPSHTYNTAGTYSVTLMTTGSCLSDSITQIITVLPYQTPFASFTYSIDSCLKSIAITNTSQNGVFYNWNFDDGSTDTSANPVHTYSSAGIYNIVLIAINACGADTVTQQLNLTDGIPSSSFITVADTCNLSVNFINNSSPGTSLWNFGDGNTAINTSPVHVFSSASVYNVTLVTTNSCGSDTSQLQIDLSGVTPVSAAFTSNVDPCTNEVTLTASATSAQLNWFINNQYYTSGTITTWQATTGTQLITLVATGTCNTDTSNITLNIPAIITPTLNYDYALDSCSGSLVISNYSTDYISAWWSFGDGTVSTESEPQHTYTNTGIYTVEVSLAGQCDTIESSFEITLTETSGLFNIPNLFTPNGDGRNDRYKIENTASCQNYTMIIYNRWGDMVYQGVLSGDGWDGNYSGNECPDGTYFCILTNGTKNYTISVLLQR